MNADEVSSPQESAIGSPLTKAVRQLRVWGGQYLSETHLSDYPVIDDDQVLYGVVSFQDVRSVMMRDDLYSMLIAVDLMRDDPPVVKADASLLEALNVFTQSEIHHLPVVDNTPNDRLVGIITRSSLMEHYSQELRRKMSL